MRLALSDASASPHVSVSLTVAATSTAQQHSAHITATPTAISATPNAETASATASTQSAAGPSGEGRSPGTSKVQDSANTPDTSHAGAGASWRNMMPNVMPKLPSFTQRIVPFTSRHPTETSHPNRQSSDAETATPGAVVGASTAHKQQQPPVLTSSIRQSPQAATTGLATSEENTGTVTAPSSQQQQQQQRPQTQQGLSKQPPAATSPVDGNAVVTGSSQQLTPAQQAAQQEGLALLCQLHTTISQVGRAAMTPGHRYSKMNGCA